MVLTEVVAVAEVEAQTSFLVGETFGGGLRAEAVAVAVALTGLIGPRQPGYVPQSAALVNICLHHTEVNICLHLDPRLEVLGRKITWDQMKMSGEKQQVVD